MSKKIWDKDEKAKKIEDMKVSLKRKSKEDCSQKEFEMIYGNPDWTTLQVEQDS